MGPAAVAGTALSSDSGGNGVGPPGADVGRVPKTPALLSSLSSSSSAAAARNSSGGDVEASGLGLVKEGSWRMEDAHFGATMIGLGREE